MRVIVDELLVGTALLASAGYALVALGPRALRPWLLSHTAALLRRVSGQAGVQRIAQRLQAAAAAKAAGACGSCGSCGRAESGPADIRIPASKIGRR
jgi:hypothetical protein